MSHFISKSNGILSNLDSGKFFTTLDLKSRFHQILIKECDREKTVFNLQWKV